MTNAAVITGASGSLGLAIAARLGQLLDAVLLVDLSEDALTSAEARINSSGSQAAISHVTCDITAGEAPELVSAALHSLGWSPHVLVNNAGINRDARATKMTEDQFRAVVRVDLVAPARLAIELRPLMPPGSSIINIASRAALGNFGQTNYVAAKSGLIALTRSLALQWSPDVRVNAVAPGLVETPMTAGMPEKVLGPMIDRIPAGRMAKPEEIAEVVAFYASPAASYVTGQLILACGGRSLAP